MNQSVTQPKKQENIELIHDSINSPLASPDELSRADYPLLQNLSAAFIFNCLPIPSSKEQPEYVYINFEDIQCNNDTEARVLISQWNLAWESGSFRHAIFHEDIPKELSWLSRYSDKNIYLVPKFSYHKYSCYAPLYHLLSRHVLVYNKLPLLKQGQWPPSIFDHLLDGVLPVDFDDRLSQAFAFHIWPYLNSGSKINAFSNRDSIVILAHNLDYWMPHIYSVVENKLKSFGRVPIIDQNQEDSLIKARSLNPEIRTERPLKGGMLWVGESEARNATKEMVEFADKSGNLRSILDAIKSNRIEDDFSDRWSFEKEDFERKLYKKRSKYKVNFVELKNTIPVQGPETEVEENQCWQDFLSILDPKEKRIVVCIRDGHTKIGEISKILGYANHSPVSKALKKIRLKAQNYIENS